jgi:hypothetical protein
MKLIGVEGFSQKDVNESVQGASVTTDPPTEKVTQWDVLALDMIRFRAFKRLINSKSCISYCYMCELRNYYLKLPIDHITLRASAINP